MGRPRRRLQTDRYDGRKFTTIAAAWSGVVSYQRIPLRTKDDDVARRRLTAPDGVRDPDGARRRVDHLASTGSETLERARPADFLHLPMFRHRMTIEDTRKKLAMLFGGFVDMGWSPPTASRLWRVVEAFPANEPSNGRENSD